MSIQEEVAQPEGPETRDRPNRQAAVRTSDPDRALICKLAAHERWSRLDGAGRAAATANARRAIEDRFLKEARDLLPEGSGDADIFRAADNLRSAHAIRAARARWRKARAS